MLHIWLQNALVAEPRMPRTASKLAPTREGGFIARRVVPFDVRNEYGKLYGQRTEERLNTGPMPIALARAKHREWSNEIEARIANIRCGAQRKGPRAHAKTSESIGRRVVRLVYRADGGEQLAGA